MLRALITALAGCAVKLIAVLKAKLHYFYIAQDLFKTLVSDQVLNRKKFATDADLAYGAFHSYNSYFIHSI